MLDVIYVLATLAIFALLGLLARGVERLGPRAAGPRDTIDGEARR